jgi:hypothetical protein
MPTRTITLTPGSGLLRMTRPSERNWVRANNPSLVSVALRRQSAIIFVRTCGKDVLDTWKFGSVRGDCQLVGRSASSAGSHNALMLNDQGQPVQVGQAARASLEVPAHLVAIQTAVQEASKGRCSTTERRSGSSARALGAGCIPNTTDLSRSGSRNAATWCFVLVWRRRGTPDRR